MFNIRNYRSDNSLQRGTRSNSKQNVRSNSEIKAEPVKQAKPNYHFTQKRDLSEGRQVKTPEKPKEQPKAMTASKLGEVKLPDLRSSQKPPRLPRLETKPPQVQMSVTQQNTNQLKSRLVMYDDPVQQPGPTKSKKELPKITREITLSVGSHTKAGFDGYATKTNQDRELVYVKSSGSGAFGVMDGHGMEGEKVSQFVLDRFKECVQNQFSSFDFVKVFPAVHEQLKASTVVSSQFSGTTATLAIIQDGILECGWVGDSRAILGKKRSTRKVDPVEVTKDHKPDQEGERIRIEQMGGHVDSYHSATGQQLGPYRVWVKGAAYPGLAMSRSLGDQVAASVGVSQVPDVSRVELGQEDIFLIVASDGVWEFMSNQQAVDLVYPFYLKNDPKSAAQTLVAEAHQIWKQFDDGIDDITCVIVFFN